MCGDDVIPENSWRDNQLLLHGLADIHCGLAACLENALQVRHATAEALLARMVAGLGTCMVEIGNAPRQRRARRPAVVAVPRRRRRRRVTGR